MWMEKYVSCKLYTMNDNAVVGSKILSCLFIVQPDSFRRNSELEVRWVSAKMTKEHVVKDIVILYDSTSKSFLCCQRCSSKG